MYEDTVKIQKLIAKFANSFDMKDWSGLEACFTESLYTDYSDLRGTPPEPSLPKSMSNSGATHSAT